MITGEVVTVFRSVQSGEDRFGEPIMTDVIADVDNVLVAPGPRADLSEADRPNGDRVAFNLHFPKGHPADLRGARISVRGGEPLSVVGNPQHYTESNTPGAWSMPVEVWRVDG